MYGWEFPPYISGGLGIACHDLTLALSQRNIKINFVLPNLKKATHQKSHVDLISSSDVILQHRYQNISYEDFLQNIDLINVNSALRPYLNEETYIEFLREIQKLSLVTEESGESFFKLNINDLYGPDLLTEVARYAYVAGQIANKVDHDIIHAHDWLTILAGIEAKKASGKKLIYHVHALEIDRSGINVNPEIYRIEKHGLEQADVIIAVSFYTKNIIVKHYGIHPNKVEVVHNAVSKTKVSKIKNIIKKSPQEKIVLFLGRVTFQKGPDYFLEAAAKVLKKQKNIKFVIAGSGDMINRLIERAAELKIGRHVIFTGFLNREQVEEVFAASDVYVMSSVSEPFGISSLEAVLFDVPVILSKQSGVAEVLKHSLKVDFWDTNDLANKIHALVKYPALQNELLVQASEELKHIQWENSAQKVEEIYKASL